MSNDFSRFDRRTFLITTGGIALVVSQIPVFSQQSEGPVYRNSPVGGERPFGPYIFLPVADKDNGSAPARTKFPQFVDRSPKAVEWVDDRSVRLLILNSGQVASDLVKIAFQFVFCTDANHGRDQGFVRSHAAELRQGEGEIGAASFVTYIAAKSQEYVPIKLPANQAPFSAWENVYFRARVSTVWDQHLNPSQWDFAGSSNVTESTLKKPKAKPAL